MNRDTGIRNLIPGVRFDDEIKEDLRSQMAIRKRLEGMATPEPVQPDVRFSPSIDLKPTEIVHKEGDFGYPGSWKSEKELDNYLVDSAKWSRKIKEKRQEPDWVASHNKRFPKFKTTQLPKEEKQQPQYGVKPMNSHDSSTFPYNQKEAMATADAMDQAVANTKTRINQIHKNPASKIIEKQQSIKDLQRVTDIAYKYSNDQWKHKPTWELDRKTGSPVDVADPKYQNAKTVRQLENLKSWSQGGKVNAPHVKLHAAPKGSDFYYNASENAMELKSSPSPHRPTPQVEKKATDNAAGTKYIDWWDRIETKNRT